MKRFKQMMMYVIATLALCFVFTNVVTVQAEEKVDGNIYINAYQNTKDQWKSNKKLRVSTYATAYAGGYDYSYVDSSTILVEYASGDKISNLKVNKKGLGVAVVSTYTDGYKYGYSRIAVYATKAGTYNVTFNVVGADGKNRGKQTVKVQAVDNDSLIKKATFGKQTVLQNSAKVKSGKLTNTSMSATKVSGKSGNLKITPNSQYKITGLIVKTVGSNGKYSYKKIKNGKSVTLSKGYAYINKNAEGYNNSDYKKYTEVYVSYKDKFFGHTATYSITSKRGKKEVKYVYKNGVTGEKSVDYGAYSTFSLWQY